MQRTIKREPPDKNSQDGQIYRIRRDVFNHLDPIYKAAIKVRVEDGKAVIVDG